MPTALLNDDVIWTICTFASSSLLYQACLVSRQWREHAQPQLFDDITIGLSIRARPTPQRVAVIRQKMYLLSRSLNSSIGLAEALRIFTYADVQVTEPYELLRGLLMTATRLDRFDYTPRQGQDIDGTILQYRQLFQDASFSTLVISTHSLHHVCLVPPRRLPAVTIKDLGLFPQAQKYEPISSTLDLSNLRIEAASVTIAGFEDAPPLGIGSTIWLLFETCVVDPRHLSLCNTVISRETVRNSLAACGSRLRQFWLMPRVDRAGPPDDWVGLLPESASSLGSVDIKWGIWTPLLCQLTTRVFFPSLHSLTTLKSLTIAWTTGMGSLAALTVLLEDQQFSPSLKELKMVGNVYQCVTAPPADPPTLHMLEWSIVRLQAACDRRALRIEPPEYLEHLRTIVAARSMLADFTDIYVSQGPQEIVRRHESALKSRVHR